MIKCCDIALSKKTSVHSQKKKYALHESGKFIFDVQKNSRTQIEFFIEEQGNYDIVIHVQSHVDMFVRMICLFVCNVTVRIHIVVCGDDAQVNVAGMYALHAQDNVSIYSVQEHIGRNSMTDVNFAGIVSEKSQILYNGMIKIASLAQQTHANLQNKNIVMSPWSRVISVPNIEVLNNDVQCFHGSAVGKFNDIVQWYMHSRGLSQLQVKQMLVQSLFAHALHEYDQKDDVIKLICEKLS